MSRLSDEGNGCIDAIQEQDTLKTAMTFPNLFAPFAIRGMSLKSPSGIDLRASDAVTVGRIGETVRDAYRCVLDLRRTMTEPETLAC